MLKPSFEISFDVVGTHRGPECNPKPKIRKTFRQRWTPEVLEYIQWKEHIIASFWRAFESHSDRYDHLFGSVLSRLAKPVVTARQRCRMDIVIYWRGHSHGDPENIFGSIADALFSNDKYLAGSFDYKQSGDDIAKVFISIKIWT